MAYEYKVAPFIGKLRSGLPIDDVSRQLELAIAQHATGGWEFYQLGEIGIEVKPGCLAGLLGAKVVYDTYNQLIFRKQS